MKAGRELDKLIQEKIFGLFVPDPVKHKDLTREQVFELMKDYDGIPRYSTDIAAAWRVVEKMADRLKHYRHSTGDFTCRSFGPGFWEAEWSDWFEDRGTVFYTAKADTAPLAICLAALEAIK